MAFTPWQHWLDRKRPRHTRRIPSRSFLPRVERLEDRCVPATFSVINTSDSGVGSLRQAILNANSNAGPDLINFNIVGTGVQTISPTSVLPTITGVVTIDGTTQPGFTNSPLIELNGTNAGSFQHGLVISAGSSTVKALIINRYGGSGILLNNLGGNLIQGCWIGLDNTGTAKAANGGEGISIQGGASNTIGGTTAGAGNVLSGNGLRGMATGGTHTVIQGNRIGTDKSGTVALGNALGGIFLGTSSSTVGGTATGAGNLISGNGGSGMLVGGVNNLVQGNLVGTDITGTVKISNVSSGISINAGIGGSTDSNTIGGTVAGVRNIISGTPGVGDGLAIFSSSNLVQGNYIGTDINGTAALGSAGAGIAIGNINSKNNTIGGTVAGAGNLISGNSVGVRIFAGAGAGHLIQGNLIGTDKNGTAALGNGTGVINEGTASATIGGTAAGAGNVISGNTGNGISMSGAANLIQGNLIGTDKAGTAKVANGGHGIALVNSSNTVGGTSAAARNVISGNTRNGVLIDQAAKANEILGNYIGTQINGSSALGNTLHGVMITGSSTANNTVGGTVTGAGNVIAFNTGNGVLVGNDSPAGFLSPAGGGNSVLGNSIFANTRLGLDLGANNGVTANDAGDGDTGPNAFQNYPVLSSASANTTNTLVSGTLNSTATRTFRIEFFSSPTKDPTNFGEGKTFLGSANVTTDGSGNATFTNVTLAKVPKGETFITATATDTTSSDTSEFSAAVQVPFVDLVVTVTDGATSAVPGNGITYTITVTNTGPDLADDALITDTFPAALTNVTWTASYGGGASGPASGNGNINATVDIPSAGTATFTVSATVSATATGTLSNTATADATAQVDGNLDDNTATDNDSLTPQADLSITKTNGVSSLVPGKETTYTIVVTHTGGPSAMLGARVQDTFAAALTNVTWTATYSTGSSGPASGSGNLDTLIDLVASGTATFTVKGTVSPSATGSLVNTATVAAPTGGTDTNTTNNSATDTDTLTPEVDLVINKNNSSPGVVPGTTTTYVITVQNNGPSTAAGAKVTDLLPAVFTSSSWTATYSSGSSGPAGGSGDLDATVTLLPSGIATFTLLAAIDADIGFTTAQNTATVTAPTGTTETDPTNNSDTLSVTLVPKADLSVTKTNGTDTSVPGTSTTYTIVVTNNGPSTAPNARVEDLFPTTLTNVSWSVVYSPNSTGPTSGTDDIDVLVTLKPGGTATFTVTADIDARATGTLDNTATVTATGDVTELDPDNDSATDTDTLTPQADLSITKTNGVTSLVPGTETTYTIVVTHAGGPSAMLGARVQDTFAAALTNVTWTATYSTDSSGPASGNGNLDTLIDLVASGTATFTVKGTVSPSATGTLANTATVSAPTNGTDTNPTNNSATDTDTLTPQVDLAITKTDGISSVVPGTSTTYTIIVSNSGPSTAAGAQVRDLFPTAIVGATWTASYSSGSSGVTSGSGVIDTTVTLLPGGTATFTVTAPIDPAATGTLGNTATVAAATGTTDTNLANNSATDTNTLTPQADLLITKTDGATSAIPGKTITYTITAHNIGPSTATAATVQDLFPATLIGVTWTAVYSSGSSGPTSGSGNINSSVTLAPNGTATITVTATIDPAARGTLSNTATVTAPAGVTDPVPGNNSATDTDTLTPQADLAVTKVSDILRPTVGEPFHFTITVTNNGPSSATGVQLTDTLPAGIFVVTNAPTQGTFSNGVWSVGTLGANATATLVLTVDLTPGLPGQALINTATVTLANEPDPVPGNNSATATVHTQPRGLIVTGADAGGGPHVLVFDAETSQLLYSFYAFTPQFRGGVRVASGDVNADGTLDIIAAAGAGGTPHIRVFDGKTGQPLPGAIGSFLAFTSVFGGGVFVASGDVNGDGFDDVIAGADAGGGPHVRVFSGKTGAEIMSFFAYIGSFHGGVRVATGDVNGDGFFDVITGAGAGGGPHVIAFSGKTGAVLQSFMAYTPNLAMGVYIAAGDVNGDNIDDIITGAGVGGGPHVRVFSGTGGELASFFAYPTPAGTGLLPGDPVFRTGARVSVMDYNLDGRADIVIGTGTGRSPVARVLDGLTLAELDSFFAYDPTVLGGFFVG